MKKPYHFPLLCFFFSWFTTHAQSDWQLFRPGVQYLYNYPDASYQESPVVGIRTTTEPCTEMYRALRWRGEFECNEFSASFMGYAVCQTDNLTQLQVREGEYVNIRQTAPLDTPWPAYAYDNDTVWAKVYLMQEETFFGLTDSVKFIHFYRQQPNGAQTFVPDDHRPIKVSKQYGLISTFWFRDFPLTDEWTANSPNLMSLAGLSEPKAGLQNPSLESIFSLQVGDEIHVQTQDQGNYYPQGEYLGYFTLKKYIKATILSVDIVPGTQKLQYYWGGAQLRIFKVTAPGSIYEVRLTPDTTGIWEYDLANLGYLNLQPGALIEEEGGWNEMITVSLENSGFCDRAAKYKSSSVSDDEFCAHPFFDALSSGRCIDGAAGYYYDAQSIGGEYKRDVVYVHQQGSECGTPLDFDLLTATTAPLETPLIPFHPNPVRGPLTITLPQGLVADLKLYDAHGRVLLLESRAQGQVEWDLGELPAGVYQIKASRHAQLFWQGRVLKI